MWPVVTDQLAWLVCRSADLLVCQLVCLLVRHTSEPCKNGWTDRDAIWFMDSGGPKEQCITWGSRSPLGRVNFWGRLPVVEYRECLPWAVRKWLTWSTCHFWCRVELTQGPRVRWGFRYPMWRDNFDGEGHGPTSLMSNDTLLWAVQKQLNRSRCHFGYGVEWSQESLWFQLKIHQSQLNILYLIFKFRSYHEIFIRRSWYSILLSLDATISCRIK